MKNVLEYKGYYGTVDFSAEDQMLFGKIDGIVDLVTFESKNADEIEKEFREAVDDYLIFCREVGKEPDKMYKGTFNVRITPDLHRAIAIEALKKGVSLNKAVEDAIELYVYNRIDLSNANMASIYSKLSEITGTLSWFNDSWKNTQSESSNTYLTSVVPFTVPIA